MASKTITIGCGKINLPTATTYTDAQKSAPFIVFKSGFMIMEVLPNDWKLYWNDGGSVTSKKLPNVYKSSPKMISQEKWKILTTLQKLPKMWATWAK